MLASPVEHGLKRCMMHVNCILFGFTPWTHCQETNILMLTPYIPLGYGTLLYSTGMVFHSMFAAMSRNALNWSYTTHAIRLPVYMSQPVLLYLLHFLNTHPSIMLLWIPLILIWFHLCPSIPTCNAEACSLWTKISLLRKLLQDLSHCSLKYPLPCSHSLQRMTAKL